MGSFELDVFDANTLEHLSNTVLGSGFEEDTLIETAFDPTTNRLFVAEFATGTLWQVDGETFEVLGETDVGSSPTDLLVNPTLRKLYVVGNSWGNTVVVDIFEIGDLEPIASITLDGDNAQMAFHERSHRVSMIVQGFPPSNGRMYVIDGWDDNLLTTVYGSLGTDIDINQRTGRVYVGNGEVGGVSVVSAWRPRIVATVELDIHFGFIKVNPNNHLVYVAQRRFPYHEYSVAVIADRSAQLLGPTDSREE